MRPAIEAVGTVALEPKQARIGQGLEMMADRRLAEPEDQSELLHAIGIPREQPQDGQASAVSAGPKAGEELGVERGAG